MTTRNDSQSINNQVINQQQQAIRELEHPFLKVPFECLNKTFRSSQKSVEKDLAVLEKAVKAMNKKAQKEKITEEDACKYLDKVVNKLIGVKRKLEETDAEQEKYLNISKLRMEYLDPKINKMSDTEWNRIHVNRILVDYFLRSGHYESAVQLAKQANIVDFVDIDVFMQSRKVIDGLEAKDCTEALNWCSEHKSKLRKLKITFEFELHIQEFIELVRREERHKAIEYARKYFKREEPEKPSEDNMNNGNKRVKFDDSEDWKKRTKQIQQAMALLAFGKNTTISPYKEMFSEDRWKYLIELFQKSYFQLFSLTSKPLLYLKLQAGLSALKNPLVYKEEHYNVNDPMCHENFQEIAKDLPFSFHVHSKLVCRLTGKLMDDRNPPMVLPNGNVYSLEAMEQMALRSDGIIEDPRTGERFEFTDRKSVV